MRTRRPAIDAVAQITKSGHVFVLDRETGKPLFPIEERSAAPWKQTASCLPKTQPLSAEAAAFRPAEPDRRHAHERARRRPTQAVLEQFRKIRSNGPVRAAESRRHGSLSRDSTEAASGAERLSIRTAGLLYVNANEMAWILSLVERPQVEEKHQRASSVHKNCASCHREDLNGTPPEFPSLVDIGKKYLESEVAAMIRRGNGRMPGFPQLRAESRCSAIAQLRNDRRGFRRNGVRTRCRLYAEVRDRWLQQISRSRWLSGSSTPPWGTLNAIDLEQR